MKNKVFKKRESILFKNILKKYRNKLSKDEILFLKNLDRIDRIYFSLVCIEFEKIKKEKRINFDLNISSYHCRYRLAAILVLQSVYLMYTNPDKYIFPYPYEEIALRIIFSENEDCKLSDLMFIDGFDENLAHFYEV